MKSKDEKSKKQKLKWIILLSIVGIIILITAITKGMPLIKRVLDLLKNYTYIVDYVRSFGTTGVIILIAIHMIQVIVVFFPSGPIRVASGLAYGSVNGTIVAMIGYILGNAIVFVFARHLKLKVKIMNNRHKRENKNKKTIDISKIKNIENIKKPYILIAILHMIPGMPNGILPYVSANTSISFPKYIITITFACIPSIIKSTVLGDRFIQGDYTIVIVIVIIAVLTLAAGYHFKDKIVEWFNGLEKQ